ncbi:MAG: hypothetical protein IPK97_11700 [Ahniella sp.]|nr:hypothetical protein [Ahniella sp.]
MNHRTFYPSLLLTLLLTACAPPPPPPASTAPQKGNPLENTVLDTQGRALQQARDVQKQVEDQAAAQRKAIDEAEGQ